MATMNWDQLAQTADDATKVLPEGEYRVKVRKAEATTASTGSPMIRLWLEPLGTDRQNYAVLTQITLTVDNGFALRRWFQALDAFGLSKAWLQDNDATLEMIAMALVGRYAKANITIEPWKGEDRNKVDGYKVDIEAIQPDLPGADALALATVGGVGEDEIQF